MIENVVGSFYEAVRKGEACEITAQRGNAVRALKFRPTKMDAYPSFDFGHLNNPPHPDAWDKELYDDLWAEWVDALSINMPFPTCIYYFRFEESPTTYETVNLFIVEQSDVALSVSTFFRQPNLKGDKSKWTKHPIGISYANGVLEKVYDRRMFDPQASASFEEDAQSNWTAIIAATLLMQRRQTSQMAIAEPSSERINVGRVKAGLSPLPSPIVVSLSKSVPEPVEHHGAGGWTMEPHNRRGHWRTRKATGKRYWVRDYAVHGGTDTSRDYVVKQ